MTKTPMFCLTGYIVVLLISYCCDANILDGKAIMCVYENTSIYFSESLPIEKRQTTTEETPQTTTEETTEMEEMVVMECQDLEVSLAEMARLERKA